MSKKPNINNLDLTASDLDAYTKGETDTAISNQIGVLNDDISYHKDKIASNTELGHVKVGKGLSIDNTGVLSSAGGDTIPSGIISMWSGSINAIPTGWALCNGQNGTPNLVDRFIVGAGSKYSVGDIGGADTVTLTTSQLPSHTHSSGTLSTNTTGSHTHDMRETIGFLTNAGSGSDQAFKYVNMEPTLTSSAGSHSHTISGSTGSTGSGSSHENRPPYYALAFIMKL